MWALLQWIDEKADPRSIFDRQSVSVIQNLRKFQMSLFQPTDDRHIYVCRWSIDDRKLLDGLYNDCFNGHRRRKKIKFLWQTQSLSVDKNKSRWTAFCRPKNSGFASNPSAVGRFWKCNSGSCVLYLLSRLWSLPIPDIQTFSKCITRLKV